MKSEWRSKELRWSVVFSVWILFVGARFSKAQDIPELFTSIGSESYVNVNFFLIEPPLSVYTLNAKLPDKEVSLELKRIANRGENNYTWFGTVKDYPHSSVILTVVDGVLSGRILTEDREYSIQPEAGAYLIREESIPNESFFHDPSERYSGNSQSPPESNDLMEDGTVIDVLGLYTTGVQIKYGDTKAKSEIQNLIDLTNNAFRLSQINTQLNLVGCEVYPDTNVEEGIDIKTARRNLQNGTASKLAERYQADLTVLVRVYTGGTCGRAVVMTKLSTDFAEYAFSVVELSPTYCSIYTFAHEIGHNLGCGHDMTGCDEDDDNPRVFSYSHAWHMDGKFATIMSCYTPKIGYFSNPDVLYNGEPTGKAGIADNARTINETRKTVANFRSSIPVTSEIVISTDAVNIPEGGAESFGVKLSAAPVSPVTVTISRVYGDTDISVSSNTMNLTFSSSNWNTYQTVMLTAAHDDDAESNSATIQISSANMTSKMVIANEVDSTLREFETDVSEVEIAEGGSQPVNIRLTYKPSNPISISVSMLTGSDPDITVEPHNLIFTDLNWKDWQPITLFAAPDADSVAGTAMIQLNGAGMTPKTIAVTEKEPVLPTLNIIADQSQIQVPEGATADLRVKLSAQPVSNVSVSVSRISGDTDITVPSGSILTFTPSNWNIEQTVTLSAGIDADAAPGTAMIQLSADGLTSVQITAVETDHTPKELIIETASLDVPETGSAAGRVKLSYQPTSPITVAVSLQSGSDPDISIQPQTLMFTDANWNLWQEITISDAKDADTTAGTAIIQISAPGMSSKEITVTEVDSDSPLPELMTDPVSSLTIPEGKTTSVDVRLSAQPSRTITGSVQKTQGASTVRVTSGSQLTFTTSDWNDLHPIILLAETDREMADVDAVFQVSANGLEPRNITVKVTDNSSVIQLPNVKLQPGTTLSVPLTLTNPSHIAIEGMDIQIIFDGDVVEPAGWTFTGGVLENKGYNVIMNSGVKGQIMLIISAFSTDLFSGSGVLLYLQFKAVGTVGSKTDLVFIKTDINEASVMNVNKLNGSAEIIADAYSLSGTVRYWHNHIPVPNVTVQVEGDKSYTSISDENGGYTFPSLSPGTYSLTLLKKDDTGGISGMDVSRIARNAIGSYPFNAYETKAGDVTLNGTIESTDVSRVSRYAAEIIDCLNDKCTDWIFDPPTQTFTLNSNQTLDITAIRLGDVTGNWVPDSQMGLRTVPRGVRTATPEIEVLPGVGLSIPIWLEQETQIEGIDITIEYDNALLTVLEASLSGGILEDKGYQMDMNIANGKATIIIYAKNELVMNKGILAYIRFDVKPSVVRSSLRQPTDSSIKFTRFHANESSLNGTFLIEDTVSSEIRVKINQVNPVGLNLSHAVNALKVLAGGSPGLVASVSSLNGDNRVGMEDAIYILQTVSGLRTP